VKKINIFFFFFLFSPLARGFENRQKQGPLLSSAVLLELPVLVIERANVPRLEPPRDTVEMKGVVAHAPGHSAILSATPRLIGLAFDALVHDVVAADRTVVNLPVIKFF
jgi:hypothetical protein